MMVVSVCSGNIWQGSDIGRRRACADLVGLSDAPRIHTHVFNLG
jgi:hypothetical protein